MNRNASLRAFFFLTVGGVLLVTFQNFSIIPIENLKPLMPTAQARVISPDGENDIRNLAPHRPAEMDQPSSIASPPTQGNSLESISSDWAQKQAHLVTGGAEERLLADVNKQVNRWIEGQLGTEAEAEVPTGPPVPADGRGPAGAVMAVPRQPKTAWLVRPTAVKFSSLNRVDVDLSTDSRLTCIYNGASTQWQLSQPINKRFDVNVQHDTNGDANSMHLNYSW